MFVVFLNQQEDLQTIRLHHILDQGNQKLELNLFCKFLGFSN